MLKTEENSIKSTSGDLRVKKIIFIQSDWGSCCAGDPDLKREGIYRNLLLKKHEGESYHTHE